MDRAVSRWLAAQSWESFLRGESDVSEALNELSVRAHAGEVTRFAIDQELIPDPEEDTDGAAHRRWLKRHVTP